MSNISDKIKSIFTKDSSPKLSEVPSGNNNKCESDNNNLDSSKNEKDEKKILSPKHLITLLG